MNKNKAHTEDTITDKKGATTSVNVDSSMNQFLHSDGSDGKKSDKTGITITQAREQQSRKLGIETKYAHWEKKSLKKKVTNMAEDDEALNLASKEDKHDAVLPKKFG